MLCGVLGNNLNGQHIIKECLTALYDRKFLKDELLLSLEDVPLASMRMNVAHVTEHLHISTDWHQNF